MFFKRSKEKKKKAVFAGERRAVQGHSAVIAVETLAGSAATIFPTPNIAQIANKLRAGLTLFRETGSPESVAGLTAGYALAGLRSTMFTGGGSLANMHESLYAAAGKHLTYTVNVTCRAITKQANSLHGGHDDYHSVADAGLFQLFAKNVQEAADFSLIAHRVAELALNPGIVAQDSYYTSHSVQTAHIPEADLVKKYLGDPSDMIECPTQSQSILFGEKRRRIPELFDLDRPAGIGAVQDHDCFFQALAAQRPFFFDHIAKFIDQSMSEFADLTGRSYARVQEYRCDDADYVIIAQGSVIESLEAVADYMRDHEQIKVGVLNVTAFRPFPGDLIAQCLKGKKAATILERVDQPLSEDLPILKEIRCAVDKSIENGLAEQPLYSEYPTYKSLQDRPQFYSGTYGIGGRNPSFSELVAAYKNMLSAGDNKKNFYVGIRFTRDDVQLPMVEALQQQLLKGYPDLDRLSLTGDAHITSHTQKYRSFQLFSVAGAGGTLAGTLLAKSISEALDWRVKTYPEYGSNLSLQPTVYTIIYSEDRKNPAHLTDKVDAALVSNAKILENLDMFSALKQGGSLVVHTELEPEKFWRSLSETFRKFVQSRELKIFYLNARHIAQNIATTAAYGEQMANQALVGAFLKVFPDIKLQDMKPIHSQYRLELERQFGEAHYLAVDNLKVMIQGGESVEEIEWKSFPSVGHDVKLEPDAPWTVKEVKRPDHTIFDLARFWDMTGYLYETGGQDQLTPDPFVATGIIPGSSGSFRDMTPYRARLPKVISEAYKDNPLSLAHCLDAGMSATVQDFGSIIKTAVTCCQANGKPVAQLQRAADHLAKQAHKIFARGGDGQYQTMGTLLKEAFAKLMKMMGLTGDKLSDMEADFHAVHDAIEHFPIIRSQKFFDDSEKEKKGSGLVLSIVFDPQSGKESDLCQKVFGSDALEMVDQTEELVTVYRQNWELFMQLPDVPQERLEKYISLDDPETWVYHLFNKNVRQAIIGGDGAFPGSGSRIAIHLLASAVEATMRPSIESMIKKLSDLISEIQDKIQGKVEDSIKINDFEQFGKKLSGIKRRGVDLNALADILDQDGFRKEINKDQLKRLTDSANRLTELRDLYQAGAHGNGRARMAMALATGSVLFWGGTYPYNPFPFPWASNLYSDAGALAEGLFESIMRKMSDTFKDVRIAELELNDSYRPDEHDTFFENFDWLDFTEEELAICPPMVVVGGDGAMGDAGFESISRLLRSQLPIKILVLDTQGYSATGGQPNSASFLTDRKDRGMTVRKELALLVSLQHNAFVAQSSIAMPGHLMQGIKEGLTRQGPALFHIYAPEPQSHGIAPDQVIEQARLAVNGRVFPIFTYNPEKDTMDLSANPAVEKDWATGVWEHDDLAERDCTFADWAAFETRFKHNFEFIAKGEWNSSMKSIIEYLELDEEEREVCKPCVDVLDNNGEVTRFMVTEEVVRDTESRQRFWRTLQLLAGVNSKANEEIIEKARLEIESDFDRKKEQLTSEYETKLADLDQNQLQIYHRRLTDKLKAYCEQQDNGDFAKSIRESLSAKSV
ncbi:MAG: hypothetical protein B6244_09605 [Candidatus Cloacimonetes bacterium 4572_55]|nr:MAG: hypothetical protein B6244_09605 [Candidatus Cloacimonetes bacterium 4572_55]